jgi:hypothetical protein
MARTQHILLNQPKAHEKIRKRMMKDINSREPSTYSVPLRKGKEISWKNTFTFYTQ